MSIQREALEQAALFRWVAFIRATLPDANMLYHVPNGGKRDRREAAKLKQQGVRAGVPDLCLPVARSGYHGLYIEMKVEKNKPTALQLEWLAALKQQGYAVAVCYGWQEAANIIENYLGGKFYE